jgi:hypothetical protein
MHMHNATATPTDSKIILTSAYCIIYMQLVEPSHPAVADSVIGLAVLDD